eukprot:611859-Alexandrium_andersonii.AAC.1
MSEVETGENSSWNNVLERQINFISRLVTDPVAASSRPLRTPAVDGGFYDTEYRLPAAIGSLDPDERRRNHAFRVCRSLLTRRRSW